MENLKGFYRKGTAARYTSLAGVRLAFARHPFAAFAYLSPGPFLAQALPRPVSRMVFRFPDIFLFEWIGSIGQARLKEGRI